MVSMRASDRNSMTGRSSTLYLWFIFSLFLVVLSALPFTILFPELGDLGGQLLAVSAFVCALSWCFSVFCGIAILFRKSLRWAVKGFTLIILLPFFGAVSGYEIYSQITTSGQDKDRAYRFAMHEFHGGGLVRRWHRVERNSQGWRSSREYLPVQKGEILTFFIGDSFVFGAVGQEDMIDSILVDAYLGESHVIYNFGRPGAGLGDYLEVAQQYRHLDPQNVLLFLYMGNDIHTGRHSSNRLESCSLCKTLLGLTDRVTLIRRLGRQLTKNTLNGEVHPETLAALARTGINPGDLNPSYLAWIFPKSPASGLSESFIAEMAAEFEGSRALQDRLLSIAENFASTNFCFVLFPFHFQVSQRYLDIESAFQLPIGELLGREVQDALLAWAKQHDICMIDLLPAIQKEQARTKELLFYPLDGHLRPAGNVFVAKKLHELGLLETGQ